MSFCGSQGDALTLLFSFKSLPSVLKLSKKRNEYCTKLEDIYREGCILTESCMSSYTCDPMQTCKGCNQRRGVTVSG